MKIFICPVCNKEFQGYGNRKYCSTNCLKIGYVDQLKGANNPNYRHGPKFCEVCNKKLNRGTKGTKCQLHRDRSGKNNSFYGKVHSEFTKNKMSENHWNNSGSNNHWYGKKHSQISKDNLSKIKKELWKSLSEKEKSKILNDLRNGLIKQLSYKETTPERIVREALKKLKIDFNKNLFLYNKFFVDFSLGKIIIEVFGDYWHANPNVAQVLNNYQIKQIKKDKARIAYLEKCGHKVIVLWEKDIMAGNFSLEQLLRENTNE